MKHLNVRIPMYFIGLFVMTIGIALSVKSNLGVSPVSSIPYTMTCVWGIEMGKATILFHMAPVPSSQPSQLVRWSESSTAHSANILQKQTGAMLKIMICVSNPMTLVQRKLHKLSETCFRRKWACDIKNGRLLPPVMCFSIKQPAKPAI